MSGKRAHGEGHVEKMKNGKWRGQLMDGYTPEGKRKIVSFKGENKKEVLSKMQDYREQADNHIHLDSGILLSEWADRWYQGYADQVQPSTYSNYKYTLNIIKTFLGSRPLIDILPLDIENFSRAISRKYSSSQITKCRAMLIQIYDAADANGLIVRNAARLAKLPKNKQEISFGEKEAKKDAFTANEVSLLMENLGNDMLGNSVRVMLGTGMRVQELLALTAEDIAEDGSTIRYAQIIGQALSIEQLADKEHFNQVASQDMNAYFVEGNMRKGEAISNVQSIYFAEDDKTKDLTELNYLEGDTMRMYFSTERKLQKIWVSKPTGTVYPLTQIPPDKYKLPNFVWFDYVRPLHKDDIFEWRPKKAGTELKSQNRRAASLPKLANSSKQSIIKK